MRKILKFLRLLLADIESGNEGGIYLGEDMTFYSSADISAMINSIKKNTVKTKKKEASN
jgi:hypothetical protein